MQLRRTLFPLAFRTFRRRPMAASRERTMATATIGTIRGATGQP